ncbi:MAG: phage holin family protein [Acidobacteriaceae bacterium]|nr:phage holin family protein [Acidobacteriota bacterium]MBV8810111.1 phage holin family protein [Acidobacteriaceae bacterium]MBV9502889.1 phage holin family protein [Acidobacteriaceae bacterium]
MANTENDRSFGLILQDVMKDVTDLVRSEVRLAKTELKQEALEFGRAASIVTVGGLLALCALGLIFTTAILALCLVLPAWAAALIVSAFAVIVAGLFLSIGMVRIRALKLRPEKTVQSLQEGAEWLRTQTR